ncbi:hypothetical protein MATL_G00077170 [Megalops atlanticus]|uniref:Nucleolar protein 8 n=1 Tax=Megalops atlanticus TaxID=7932 RepID=A0A9D3Q7Y8_MEGAT|nr:hypothetical protein MATL_G00077170 [Megalops atlanticus]
MKRLYIGGLGHTVSQKDLKDRFGKFGEVLDVEIVTRKDGTGMPLKTFGYININISDADLKKCMTVLNKSKWKGGTLQIEMAKESFLHRLAQERQQATEKSQSPTVEHKDKLMESFKKAGVENFHMKAAVPGTEIPGHKDWVVSKFGRVLPVLHLKGHSKNKISFCLENALKQQQDNQKRLAALEQRQKEAEQQKKLIQGALSALDTPVTSKGKHIVFEWDDESEGEAEQSTAEPGDSRASLFEKGSESSSESSSEEGPGTGEKQELRVKEFQKQGGGKLFDSSEDEEEDDGERFQIKPQFEGKAGQKLMQLQSRFGTDERFRMDSRFLESDDELNIAEETPAHSGVEVQLEEEKKKSLDILQTLLNINVHSAETSKETRKSQAFRDISALHYDPTREEHSTFETKSEEPKKESKAARRKKREEAEKLPEVSKEIFYDVAVDLKEVFGSQKESTESKQAIAWDKEEEEENVNPATAEETAVGQLTVQHSNESDEKAESTGFKFSFFGDDTAQDTTVKDDYKIEILKGAKVPWQENPCFQDSSSEEEEEEEAEEGTGDQSAPANASEAPVEAKKTFFFFFQDDERLKEGPKMFCRSAKLEDQRGHWEEKRTSLIEEYRKKHKDARRRLKASQRS